MKIKINGIYNKYNNEVDLTNKCTIFIGENGIGKSTTMKVLEDLLKGDFISILYHNFNNIELIEGNEKVFIKYEDLFPTIEQLINIVENNTEKFEINGLKDIYIRCLNDLKKVIESDKNLYFDLVKELFHNSFNSDYSKYNSCLIKRLTVNSTSKDHGYHNIDIDHLFETFSIIYAYFLLNNSIDGLRYYKYTNFYNEKQYDKVLNILNPSRKVFMLLMLRELQIVNGVSDDREEYTLTTNRDFRELQEYFDTIVLRSEGNPIEEYNEDEDIYEDIELADALLRDDFKKEDVDYYDFVLSFDEKKAFLKELFDKYTVDEIASKTTFNKDYDLDSNDKYDVYDDINYLNRINISKLLLQNFYDKEMVMKFTKDYYEMLKKMVNNEYKLDDVYEELYFYNNELREKINLFLLPLIPDRSFLSDFDFGSLEHDYERRVFNKFLIDHVDEYSNYTSKKINILNNLFDKYFKNKKIYCSPTQLILSFDEKNYINDLDLKNLSEGESRIILLFLVSVLNDDSILLIDEPETSLSVRWQKNLINDLLDNCTFKNFIVATQSPFIVEDDKLFDNVVCLPGGRYNG